MKPRHKNFGHFFFIVLFSLTQPTAASTIIGHASSPPPPPQIAVAPSKATIDITQGQAGGSIRVFNLGKKAVSINTSVSHWTMDRLNKIQVIAPTSESLQQSLIINPISFTVQPGKQQVVRYSVRPRSKPSPGEHRAMVFFNQVPDPVPEGTVGVNFRMGVAIYATAGKVTRTGLLHNLSVSQTPKHALLSFDIESVGNGHVRLTGQVSIWPRSEFPGASAVSIYDLTGNSTNLPPQLVSAATLNALPVLQNSRRTIETKVTIPTDPGQYIVHVNGALGNQPISQSFSLGL